MRFGLYAAREVGEEGLDEGGDGGFAGFDGGRVAEVAEGFAGDGADGGEGDVWWEGEVGGFEEVRQRLRAVDALVKVMASG